MKRKLPLLFSVLGCAALGLAAGEADAQAKFNLRWGHYLADSPFVQLEKDFTQEIEKRTNGHRVARVHDDFRKHTGCGRRHLDRDLVGFELDQRLIGGDGVARLLVPLPDRRLDDGFS